MLAVHAPFLEEMHRPPVHAHGADRKNEGNGVAGVAGVTDFEGDLVAEHGVEILERTAGYGLEGLGPPALPLGDLFGRLCTKPVQCFEIPAGGKVVFEQRAFQGADEIDRHYCCPFSFGITLTLPSLTLTSSIFSRKAWT